MAEEEKEDTSGTDADEHTSLADDQIIALATLGATAGPPSKAELQAYLGKSAALQQTLAARGGHATVAGVSLTVQQLRDALSALFAGSTEHTGCSWQLCRGARRERSVGCLSRECLCIRARVVGELCAPRPTYQVRSFCPFGQIMHPVSSQKE